MGVNTHDRKSLVRSRSKLRRRLRHLRGQVQRVTKLIARRDKQIKALPKNSQRSIAVHFLLARVGRHEDAGRPNRAKWLDSWALTVGKWMIGQPWCGLTVFMALRAAGVSVSPRTVSTSAIRDMAQRGVGGFKAWHPAGSGYRPLPGDVPVYGTASTGPVHTGMVATSTHNVEGNTSPGNGGSQNDGGGLYLRKRSERAAWTLGYAVPDYTH